MMFASPPRNLLYSRNRKNFIKGDFMSVLGTSRSGVGIVGFVLLLSLSWLSATASAQAHLLLTEVCVMGSDYEFIEIYNPTEEAVDLGNYYLTDAIYYDQAYFRLPEGNPQQSTVGGGEFYDFHGRFPAGAMIQPQEVMTVAITSSENFTTSWGIEPDFEVVEDGPADTVPELLEIFPGSTWGAPGGGMRATLTNSAEIMMLYYWDGASELVTDVDMFFWGASTSARVDKTGYTIGSSTYLPDTPVVNQDDFSESHELGGSYQRVSLDEGSEPSSGGNGPEGHDETGEPLNTTWTANPIASPGTLVPGYLTIVDVDRIPIAPAPGQMVDIVATLMATDVVTSVDLHYQVDGGVFIDLAMTDNLDGTWTAVLPGFPLATLVEYYVDAADDQGRGAVWPEGAPGALASYTVDEPSLDLARLLLTEVATLGSVAEFFEIYNPNDFDVPLDDYYVTDAVYYETQAYWNLPAGNPSQGTIGGGDFSDFHARFPAGAILPAGETITITVRGSSDFETTFGLSPDFELFEDDFVADGITDMAEVFPGSINGSINPTLTNLNYTGTYWNGELIALYFWDGFADLVVDVDIFIWGEGNSYSASKAGITIGSSTYAPEAGYPDPYLTEHEHLESYQRVDFDEGTEAQSGSNGIDGADETSENLNTTWEVADATPGSCPPDQPWLPDVADHPDDQGYVLDISWPGHRNDSAQASNPVTEYDLQTYDGTWESVLLVAAAQQDTYTVSVDTDVVFVLGFPATYAAYRIVAATADTLITYTSDPDSAYSVDDIAPPAGTVSLYDNPTARVLLWEAPDLADFGLTCVYRGTYSGFAPDSPVVCTGDEYYVEDHLAAYWYVIRFVDSHGNVGPPSNEVTGDYPTGVPEILETRLRSVHPNPFNPSTTIAYDIAREGRARLDVYDLLGRRVATLVDRIQPVGRYTVVWGGRDDRGRALPSGAYVCRFESGGATASVRLMLVR